MRRLVVVLAFLFLLLFNSVSRARAAQLPSSAPLVSAGSTQIPVPMLSDTLASWSGGALLVIQYRHSGSPVFQIIDPQGNEISRTTFTIPGGAYIQIFGNSIARGPDGSLAVIGTAYTDDSRAAKFLCWLSPDGKEQRIVRLSPFAPETVTVAADGSIWVAGHDPTPIDGKYDRTQDLIRRYDRTGKLLGSFVRWSSLETPPRSVPPDVYSILGASADRVVWYSPPAQTYVEFSLDGSKENRIKAPRGREGGVMLHLALCEDNSTFVSATLLNGPNQKASWGIYALDRETSEWSFIPRTERFGKLYGCDGTRLASTTDNRTITWLAPAAH